MADDRAARRYAQAAFDAAKAANAIPSVESDLHAISGVFANEPQLRAFILSPDIPRDKKHLAFDTAFRDANPLTKQLLKVMIDKRRESLMGVMATEFETLRREYETTIRAVVSSAQPLSDDEKARLVTKMSQA
ncbi:ATP synthase F1 subunit delta, partial [bacterium]